MKPDEHIEHSIRKLLGITDRIEHIQSPGAEFTRNTLHALYNSRLHRHTAIYNRLPAMRLAYAALFFLFVLNLFILGSLNKSRTMQINQPDYSLVWDDGTGIMEHKKQGE